MGTDGRSAASRLIGRTATSTGDVVQALLLIALPQSDMAPQPSLCCSIHAPLRPRQVRSQCSRLQQRRCPWLGPEVCGKGGGEDGCCCGDEGESSCRGVSSCNGRVWQQAGAHVQQQEAQMMATHSSSSSHRRRTRTRARTHTHQACALREGGAVPAGNGRGRGHGCRILQDLAAAAGGACSGVMRWGGGGTGGLAGWVGS